MSLKRPALLGLALAAVLAAAALFWFGLVGPETGQEEVEADDGGAAIVAIDLPAKLSAEAQAGKRLFEAHCTSCHGGNAVGRQELGPPLVHIIYEPGHHGDESFQRAVALGVRRHHWRFGNMPPVEGLSRAEVALIVAYVRELQRANGIGQDRR